jgi:hypothetical protein
MRCFALMRRIVVLVSLVAASTSLTMLYAPSRAEAQCTEDSAGQPCCDAKIGDHWADPACEPEPRSLLSSTLIIGGIIALIGLPFLFVWRVLRETGRPPTVHPDY